MISCELFQDLVKTRVTEQSNDNTQVVVLNVTTKKGLTVGTAIMAEWYIVRIFYH